MARTPTLARRRIEVSGAVQGVGFRPFVYREAVACYLAGWVANGASGVVVEVEGEEGAVAAFCHALTERPPPRARIDEVRVRVVAPRVERGFRIVASRGVGRRALAIGPDIATCDVCCSEIGDPADRRHRYPFTNCTACGPRYTIVRDLPYDRATTTMAAFELCGRCRREYLDPADRRFHAEPTACPACGPQLRLATAGGAVRARGDAALGAAVERLASGGVVAVKGIGGYHLACDAGDAAAVHRLRTGKRRDHQPFAVMVASVDAARGLVTVDELTAELLASPRAPIVLAPRVAGAPVAEAVAPRTTELGVMLPYSPLHHLLARGTGRPLVMTSGNVSGERIVHDDAEAQRALGPIVDAVLAHDRPVHVPCDDSVVRARGGRATVVRRARGYVPEQLPLPVPAGEPILAVGAALKSTVALAHGATVTPSHHLGDLGSLGGRRAFHDAVDHLMVIAGIEPAVVAHDLHPDYPSTAYATDLGLPTVAVQHHHAHVAACLAEHGEPGPVVGVAFDGLGFGADGTLWGGEILVADLLTSARAGRLCPVPLPGGEAAIREPWRMALAWVHHALGPAAAASAGTRLDPRWRGVLAVVDAGAAPFTSGMGRLFDAVAALLGVRAVATYEGQAAVELETLAAGVPPTASGGVDVVGAADGTLVLDPGPFLSDLVGGAESRADRSRLAARFHDALAGATVEAASRIAASRRLDTAVLTGGSFQNQRLAAAVERGLVERGLRVLVHSAVPPNDGGISVGQAAIAAARSAAGALRAGDARPRPEPDRVPTPEVSCDGG